MPAFGVPGMSQPFPRVCFPLGSVVPPNGLNDCRGGEPSVVRGVERLGWGCSERRERWKVRWISLWITLWITQPSGLNRFAAAGDTETTRRANPLDAGLRCFAFHVKHMRPQNRDRIRDRSCFLNPPLPVNFLWKYSLFGASLRAGPSPGGWTTACTERMECSCCFGRTSGSHTAAQGRSP